MNRRKLLQNLAALTTILALPARAASAKPKLVKSKVEWKQLLPPAAYAVLFEHDTERPDSTCDTGASVDRRSVMLSPT